ncbi:MAG: response regulator [bacterium]|nr:response regulator [bacterium]
MFRYLRLNNAFNGIDLNFLLISDPWSSRFDTDRHADGSPTLLGKARRNLVAEEQAKQAGLAPGQVRPRGWSSRVDLPKMKDPHKLARLQILSAINFSVYRAAPEILPRSIFNSVRLTVKNGNSIYSPYSGAAFGMIQCGALGDIQTGYEYGSLSLNFVEKYDIREIQCKAGYIVSFLINPWTRPLRDSTKPLSEAYTAGLESGDLEFAASSTRGISVFLFNAGEELARVDKEIVKSLEAIRKLNQEGLLRVALMFHQFVLNIRGMAEKKVTKNQKQMKKWARRAPMNYSQKYHLLEATGYVIIQAGTAEDGIKLARDESPALVLMDISLPGMDGLTAGGILKQGPDLKDIPIATLTAHAMRGDEEKALSAGCIGVIAKSIDTKAFPQRMARFLKSEAGI